MADPLERFRPTSETLRRSLLDRVVDLDPDLLEDRPKTVGAQMEEIRENLRRDLETLLNTRRPPVSPPEKLAELDNALVSFGVDGFFITSLVTTKQRENFAERLETRIRLFEPRFEAVRVSVLPARNPSERSLRLRIEASYVAQAGFPAVAFETAVDPSTQRIVVEAPHG
ncbi:type VI secretion system baseplate subunit TssE [Mesorhizobium sp. RP14(2022)]|uniref:Type VI secretion system baseplate subunit TssE n=1 Tax=Mesorhizobium liriopis TaxID=2953882 RepID=A0ABT1CAB3_9HYPH|nr:type VI secretion system baseplate subunit TssE [Mesorhizobium liriopis]MCO6051759.1 type VI secretion system baseplate subunit TssE [Mesorhizobium liriopis]